MADDSEARRMLEALKGELRENRKLMQTVHEDLDRERRHPPAWLDGFVRRVENLEQDLYGNGRDGLKTIVTRLEEATKRVNVKEDGEVSIKLLVAIVAAIATVVTALVNGAFMVVTNGGG